MDTSSELSEGLRRRRQRPSFHDATWVENLPPAAPLPRTGPTHRGRVMGRPFVCCGVQRGETARYCKPASCGVCPSGRSLRTPPRRSTLYIPHRAGPGTDVAHEDRLLEVAWPVGSASPYDGTGGTSRRDELSWPPIHADGSRVCRPHERGCGRRIRTHRPPSAASTTVHRSPPTANDSQPDLDGHDVRDSKAQRRSHPCGRDRRRVSQAAAGRRPDRARGPRSGPLPVLAHIRKRSLLSQPRVGCRAPTGRVRRLCLRLRRRPGADSTDGPGRSVALNIARKPRDPTGMGESSP